VPAPAAGAGDAGAAPGRRSARGPGRPPCLHAHAGDALGRDRPGGVADELRQVDADDDLLGEPDQVDPRHHQLGQIEPVQHRLDVQGAGDPVQVDPRHHQLGQIQPVQHGPDVESLRHPVEVHPPDHELGQIEPVQHRLDI
jgi:hypothetical protein